MMQGRVLIIAGSDSSGGAGVQADIKAVHQMGAYAASALCALTAQNSMGVTDILEVPAAFVTAQMQAVLSDIGADICKTGMLYRRDIIEAVMHCHADYSAPPLIVDPVMVASSGAKLMHDDALSALRALVLPHAFLLTPNMPEAEILCSRRVENIDDMKHAADYLMHKGAQAALIKGGHSAEHILYDVLATQKGFHIFEHERIETRHTHGTGCTLASAIAARLALGDELQDAVRVSIDYVHQAIKTAPQFGRGAGPINHAP